MRAVPIKAARWVITVITYRCDRDGDGAAKRPLQIAEAPSTGLTLGYDQGRSRRNALSHAQALLACGCWLAIFGELRVLWAENISRCAACAALKFHALAARRKF